MQLYYAINRYLSRRVGNYIEDEFRFGQIEKSSQHVWVVYPFPTGEGESCIAHPSLWQAGESRSRVLNKSIKLFTEHSLRIVTVIGPIKRYPANKLRR